MTDLSNTVSIDNFPATVRLHHATKGKAERLHSAFAADYPALALVAELNEDESGVFTWIVVGPEEAIVYEGDKLPDLADVLETAVDMDIDPEEGLEDEDTAPSSSVVDEAYRRMYREVSPTGQTCGDWLALFFDDQTTDGAGKSNVFDLIALLDANGLSTDTAKWARSFYDEGFRSNGWQGRLRMSGRLAMEKMVAKRGTAITAQGEAIEVPSDALADLRTKHAKWLAKEEKREAAEAQEQEAA